MVASHFEAGGRRLLAQGRWVRFARLEEEWYEDLDEPGALIEALRRSRPAPDVFTFWQRLPDTEPRHPYLMERDSIAAIPISSQAHWWAKQIDGKTRNMVRRAEKKGVVCRMTSFDDAFIAGMAGIFNETPIRQGKRFWHYGKDCATLKREFGRFLFREEVFGAYLGEELVGFSMLAFAGKYAVIGQILSKIAHRDKAPNNLLIAKAVERCAERALPYLVYAKWVDGSLGEFKRSNGFIRYDLPRYFVPLTGKGRAIVGLRLHRGVDGILPPAALRWGRAARRIMREGWRRKRGGDGA